MDSENKLTPDASTSANSRQAIFTPPTVEAPTQPTPRVTPEPGSGLVADQQPATSDQRHPFFAHHPTQTFNTDTGDIILAHEQPKSSFNKKPFIIGLVALLVFVVIAFVIVGAVASQDSQPSKGTTISTTATGQALNQYANYLLFGEESAQPLEGDYDRWEVYELEDQLESDTKDASYWGTVIDLLGTVQKSYDETVLSQAEDLADEQYGNVEGFSNALAADLDALKMLQAYHASGEVVDNLILTNYLAGGVEGVKNYIRNLYAPLANADSTVAQSYFEQIVEQYALTAQSLDLYRSYGCIVNRALDETCADTAYERSTDIQSLEDEIATLWSKNDTYINSTVQRLESNCWVFSRELSNLANMKGSK